MIKKLRSKFVLICTLSVFIMLIIIMLLINISNYSSLNKKADDLISYIVINDGSLQKHDINSFAPPPPAPSREAMFDTRFFIVYYDNENKILGTKMESIYSIDKNTAKEYANHIISSQKDSGFIDDFRYLNTTIHGNSAIVFVDVSKDIETTKDFLYNSAFISLTAMILIVLLSYILSPYAIKPIASAYEKQKKFITNASHEIKTPLTVISANIDIIEMSAGESKWIKSSKEQIQRLTELVNSLVSLSRMEEDTKIQKSEFSFSETADMIAENYTGLAITQKKTFNTNIEKDITYTGDINKINQLIYILLDNAFKYSNDNGNILLEVKQQKSKIYLIVSNSVDNMEKGTHNALFDRFYRPDESRNNQTGGFGIGLALAKGIVDKHGGKITAKCKTDNYFTIEVTL